MDSLLIIFIGGFAIARMLLGVSLFAGKHNK